MFPEGGFYRGYGRPVIVQRGGSGYASRPYFAGDLDKMRYGSGSAARNQRNGNVVVDVGYQVKIKAEHGSVTVNGCYHYFPTAQVLQPFGPFDCIESGLFAPVVDICFPGIAFVSSEERRVGKEWRAGLLT